MTNKKIDAIVTTAGRAMALEHDAMAIAKTIGGTYIPRRKRSVKALLKHYGHPVIVVGTDRLSLYRPDEEEPFYFHPNSAMFRFKRVQNGEHDPLLDACQIKKGDRVLDCTLGLGSDAILLSHAIGEKGTLTALETEPLIAFIVDRGFIAYEVQDSELEAAMGRIDVHNTPFEPFLKALPDNSYDVVYFDPMFEQTIEASDGISTLRQNAHYSLLTKEAVREATRVATKRVVLKDHFRSERFEKGGFHVIRRPSASFHFGYIDLTV